MTSEPLKIGARRGPRPRPVLERLNGKIVKVESGCWEWQGPIDINGYEYMSVGSKADGSMRKAKAHRLSYELLVGPVPDGLDLDHLCRNRRCVYPLHLESVSRRENLRRGIGLVGEQLSRNHCTHGHPYTDENTYIYRGARVCRTCKANQQRARRERRAA